MSEYELPVFSHVHADANSIMQSLKCVSKQCLHSINYPYSQYVKSETYLQWANLDLQEGTEKGFSNCVMNCNRAIIRAVDELLFCNNLDIYLPKRNPEKLTALRHVGIPAYEVIYEQIVEIRNDHEHEYAMASNTQAKSAFEIADLFLKVVALEPRFRNIPRERRVLFGDDVVKEEYVKKEGQYITIVKEPKDPLFLVDCIDQKYWIIDFQLREANWISFKELESQSYLEIAKWCQQTKPAGSQSDTSWISRFKATVIPV